MVPGRAPGFGLAGPGQPVHNARRMTSHDPSEVRCPNCGRLTPFAPFCTHCGAVVQEGATGARPHAMDRDELERRIRQRRQEGPFHRGEDERPEGPRTPASRSAAFVPEPADELVRHEVPPPEEQPRVDYFDERAGRRVADDQASWGAAAAPVAPPGAGGIPGAAIPPAQVDWPSRDLADEEAYDAVTAPPEEGARYEPPAVTPLPPLLAASFVPERAYQPPPTAPSEPPYRPDGYQAGHEVDDAGDDGPDDPDWAGYDDDEPPRRRSGALPIVGFLVLGLAALLGGAFIFAAMNAPVGQLVQSPTPSATTAPSEGSATPSSTESPSVAPSPTTSAPADNFSAKVEPCASSRMGFSGCVDDGSRLSGNQVWVWVGFKNGQASTVIGVTIVSQATHSAVGDGSLELDQLVGCDPGKTCSGYMQMSFGNLDPGGYQIQITRDGDKVASTTFSVTS